MEFSTELEDILASFWHLTESYERAIECTSPECHHAAIDKDRLKADYNEQLAKLCGSLVELILEDA